MYYIPDSQSIRNSEDIFLKATWVGCLSFVDCVLKFFWLSFVSSFPKFCTSHTICSLPFSPLLCEHRRQDQERCDFLMYKRGGWNFLPTWSWGLPVNSSHLSGRQWEVGCNGYEGHREGKVSLVSPFVMIDLCLQGNPKSCTWQKRWWTHGQAI